MDIPASTGTSCPQQEQALFIPICRDCRIRIRPVLLNIYLAASEQYRKKQGRNYWDAVREQERSSDRYLFGDEILWSAHAVPVGEREVRGILPISTLDEMENYADLHGAGHP